MTVRVEKPAALLLAAAAAVEVTRRAADYAGAAVSRRDDYHLLDDVQALLRYGDRIVISRLLVRCIVGVNPWERREKQTILVDMTLHTTLESAAAKDRLRYSHNYRDVCKQVAACAEASSFKTVEALADAVARTCICDCGVPAVTVTVDKPSALLFADAASVEITRSREDFLDSATHAASATARMPIGALPSSGDVILRHASDSEPQ